MKKSTLLFAALMLVVSLNAKVHPFAGGNGTVESPYEIKTAVQLDSVRNYMEDHFILMNDIDLSTEYPVWLPLGKTENAEKLTSFVAFNGTFDGQGHVISGIKIIYTGTYVGFFAVVGGTIKNLGVKGTVNAEGASVGLLAGYLGQSTVSIIENCFAEGTVVATLEGTAGGAGVLLGTQTKVNSVVRNCYSAGSVTNLKQPYTGGICGRAAQAGGMVTNCYSTAKVVGQNYVGGVIGRINGNNVNYNYSTGEVEGNEYVGGVAGEIYSNSTTSGLVAANSSISATTGSVGRVVGNKLGDVEDVYGLKDIDIKLKGVAQGVTNSIYDKDGGTVDLEDLQSIEFYEDDLGWDFENDWAMPEETGFPILKWQAEDASGIDFVNKNDIIAFFQGNILHVQDVKIPSRISVYTLNGQLMKRAENITGNVAFILPQTGIYIVESASKDQIQSIKLINR